MQVVTDKIVSRFVRKCLDFNGNHTTMNLSMQISMISSDELIIAVRTVALNSLQVKLFIDFSAFVSSGDISPNASIWNVFVKSDKVSATANDMISILCGLYLVFDFSVTTRVNPFPNNPTSKNKHARVTME